MIYMQYDAYRNLNEMHATFRRWELNNNADDKGSRMQKLRLIYIIASFQALREK